MTYAMSMSSEVTTKTIRINMNTNHNGPRAAITMNEAATTQMRGAMKIAAQSVVAYLPIASNVPLRPDARASGRGGYSAISASKRCFVRAF